ncbi:MAG: hypothetical protein QOJ64_552, partial [Acidobacteriota bacterium]|nr:hypothetical protein [Acidobacteriota bacterium]
MPTLRQIFNSQHGAKWLMLFLPGIVLGTFLLLTFAQVRREGGMQGRRGTGAQTVNVRAGADLQKAINEAQPGDTLILDAGAPYLGTFTLPNKGTSTEWITIRTSTPDSALPSSEQRIAPSNSSLLPKLLSSGNGEAALQTAPGAHHY